MRAAFAPECLGAIFSSKNIKELNYDYRSPEYRHCNFKTCVDYISEIGFVPGEFEFISLLREPLKLVSSVYFWESGRVKDNEMFQFDTVEEMFETEHYKYFIDKNFFEGYEEYNIRFFDVENMQEAIQHINKKHNLNLQAFHKNRQNGYRTLDLSESELKRIYQDHNLYQLLV